MALSLIIRGFELAASSLEKVLSKRGTRLSRKIEAVRTMERAINNTRAYLVNSRGRYKANTELSDLWNEAFAAMLPIDKDLAKRLNANSRFWSDPAVWQLEPAAMELVPELDELSEQCDLILVELMRRLK
jgi:hypothetical protein